jgi:hypothetical protein
MAIVIVNFNKMFSPLPPPPEKENIALSEAFYNHTLVLPWALNICETQIISN